MNFLVDAQLPPALARWIATTGHQAAHVFDLGFHTANDPMIWERAGNALLTWLEPLWPEAVRRLEQGEKFIELRG